MSDLCIRVAGIDDLQSTLRLLQQASLPTEDVGRNGTVRCWVAETGGEIVGTIGLEQYGTTGLLRSLAVAPSARSLGIGTALVATLERASAAEGIVQLVLLTETASPFFERLGYRAIPRVSAPDEVKRSAEFQTLCPASAVCMIKSLGSEIESSTRQGTTRVLFLCTGNSCRSILGEATFNHLAPAGWSAMSAGSRPTGSVHPRSLALLAREGIPTAGCSSKSWDDLPEVPDVVITVCSSAAGEACPAYLGPVLRTHWGVDDPAHASGTDEAIDAAFTAAYRTLRRRIEAFLALPLADLRGDSKRLKAELDRIGEQVP